MSFETDMRRIDEAIWSSNDPSGKTVEELRDIAEWHSAITNGACECEVCMLVASRYEGGPR